MRKVGQLARWSITVSPSSPSPSISSRLVRLTDSLQAKAGTQGLRLASGSSKSPH
jgi:hypothetical protein